MTETEDASEATATWEVVELIGQAPTITAIIPAHNESSTLQDSVQSLRDQTRPPDVARSLGVDVSFLGHVVAAAVPVIAGAAVVTIVRVLRARSRNHNV